MKILKRIHYGYIIVFCCCLIMAANVSLMMGCAGIFYEPVSKALGVSVGTFGLYLSVVHLSSALMLPIAGKLMERYSARILLTASAAAVGLTFIGMSQFNAVWQFYVAGAIFGMALAFLLYLSFPTLVNRWFNTKVGFLIGLCSAASGIGGVLFNPFGAWLITSFGWRITYLSFGAIILVFVVPVIALLLWDYPADKGQEAYGRSEEQAGVSGVEYSQAIRMPVFYGMMLFSFLLAASTSLNVFIPSYAVSSGYPLTQASVIASAVMVGVTVGKVVLGMINDKSSALGIVITVVCTICGLVLLILGRNGIALLVAGGFLFGWGYAAVTVESALLVRLIFGGKNYAQIYSNIAMTLSVANTVAAGGWGLLSDYTGFVPVFCICIVLMLILGAIGFYSLKFKQS